MSIDWNAVKVGDPDITDFTDAGVDEEHLCTELGTSAYDGLALCCRIAGHDAPHVAGDGAQVLAVWS